MSKAKLDKVQAELNKAIQERAPCMLEPPIPVLVTLDNGVKYKGEAYEAQAPSDNFPNGLIMVSTGSADIGVPINYIKAR